MSDQAGFNPYAPSNVVDQRTAVRDSRIEPAGISSVVLGLLTMAAVSLSGALFGMTAVTIIGFSNGGFGAGGQMLLALGITFIYGGIIAMVGSIFTVPVAVFCFALGKVEIWSPGRIRGLASLSGGISGFLCIAVPAAAAFQFELEILAFATVPAAFGAVGTLAMMEPVARRAARVRQRLLDQALQAAPSINLAQPADRLG